MNEWQKADAQASRALDQVLGEPVTFQPMRPRQGGGRVVLTKDKNPTSSVRDTSREPRPRPGETGFRCVASWKSSFMDAGDNETLRDIMASNDVALDFDRALFVVNGVEQLPRIGDVFTLLAESGDTLDVQQAREPYDDGGQRILILCIAPE